MQPRIGWSKDLREGRNNVNDTVERKTVLSLALAISETIKEGEQVPQRQWKNFCDELHAHMSNMSANQFLDGEEGFFAQPLVDCLFDFSDDGEEGLDFMDDEESEPEVSEESEPEVSEESEPEVSEESEPEVSEESEPEVSEESEPEVSEE